MLVGVDKDTQLELTHSKIRGSKLSPLEMSLVGYEWSILSQDRLCPTVVFLFMFSLYLACIYSGAVNRSAFGARNLLLKRGFLSYIMSCSRKQKVLLPAWRNWGAAWMQVFALLISFRFAEAFYYSNLSYLSYKE